MYPVYSDVEREFAANPVAEIQPQLNVVETASDAKLGNVLRDVQIKAGLKDEAMQQEQIVGGD